MTDCDGCTTTYEGTGPSSGGAATAAWSTMTETERNLKERSRHLTSGWKCEYRTMEVRREWNCEDRTMTDCDGCTTMYESTGPSSGGAATAAWSTTTETERNLKEQRRHLTESKARRKTVGEVRGERRELANRLPRR